MNPMLIAVPFPLAEEARVFLSWLGSEDSALPADQKKHITEWLEGYDHRLLSYIHGAYGHWMMVNAVALSDKIAEKFVADLNASIARVNDEYLQQLDKDIFGNG